MASSSGRTPNCGVEVCVHLLNDDLSGWPQSYDHTDAFIGSTAWSVHVPQIDGHPTDILSNAAKSCFQSHLKESDGTIGVVHALSANLKLHSSLLWFQCLLTHPLDLVVRRLPNHESPQNIHRFDRTNEHTIAYQEDAVRRP